RMSQGRLPSSCTSAGSSSRAARSSNQSVPCVSASRPLCLDFMPVPSLDLALDEGKARGLGDGGQRLQHLAKRERRFPSPMLAAPAAQAARVQDFRGNETSTACCHQGGWRNCAAFRARLERARILEEMRRIEGETFFHRLDAFLQGKPV